MLITSVLIVLAVRYMGDKHNYPQSHYEIWRVLLKNVVVQIMVANALMAFCFWLYFAKHV